MKIFWVSLTVGSLVLNIVQAVTFPVHDSWAEYEHEGRTTTILMQAIIDNVVANGGHLITLPPGRFYLTAPLNGNHLLDHTTIRGSAPNGSTELIGGEIK